MSTAEDFHKLVSEMNYPMYVVTAAAGGERSGCLVGFTTQASLHPPRWLAMLSKANHTFGVAARAEGLIVHFLGRADRDLASLFGEETTDQIDKFTACSWHEGPFGAPILEGVRGWVAGAVLARWDAGDHVGHLLDPVAVGLGRPDPLLMFQETRDFDPGHPA